MAKGGARPGAGRPKGSKYLDLRAELEKRDPEALDTFIEFLLANYMEDTKLMIWVGEHLFGKPTQPIEGDFSGTLTLAFDPTFNAPTRQSEADSGQ
jgi:hypothetical protein